MANPTGAMDPGNAAVDLAARREALSVLADSSAAELAAGLAAMGELPAHEAVRRPESGLVMVRGRIGGDGAPFNLGEATVARAAVRLTSGELGFSYVLGRDHEKARLVALCDALLQNARHHAAVERCVLAPLRSRRAAERAATAEQTAATRVDFFTLVRGEDS